MQIEKIEILAQVNDSGVRRTISCIRNANVSTRSNKAFYAIEQKTGIAGQGQTIELAIEDCCRRQQSFLKHFSSDSEKTN